MSGHSGLVAKGTGFVTSKAVLFVASAVAAFIGLSLLTDPHHFYVGYGFELSAEPSLMSEIRGTAGSLVSAALALFIGGYSTRWRAHAAALGAVLYLGYAGGRAVGMLVSGLPHPNLMYAAVAELALGAGCAWVYAREHEAR